jgi:hypothetical protein
VEGVRGKLNLAETLKSGKHLNGRTICQIDELTQDVVINRGKPHTMNACGALVYPTVDEDFDFSYRYKETGHRIFVRTVNLGQPWRKIEERVKEIVKGEGRDEW